MYTRKNARRAFMSSLVALVLCLTMLMGTTFAWFTDTASVNVNKIVAGTLDIDLVDANGDTLEGKTLDFIAKDGNTNILWEPGCTYELPMIKVINKGNLAAKLDIVVTGIEGDAELNEVIEWTFNYGGDVSYYDYNDEDGIIYGLSANKELTVTISGHMKEEAGNEYQGLTIDGIGITVYATQLPEEYDSYDNMYDAAAEFDKVDKWDGSVGTLSDDLVIDTAAEFAGFAAAVNAGDNFAGKTVKLNKDIDLDNLAWTTIANFAGTFDGQGHTVSNLKDAALFGTVNGTVKNLKMEDISFTTASYLRDFGTMIRIAKDGAVIDNCTADGLTITTTSGEDDGNSVGGLIGRTVGTAENSVKVSNTTISNVTFNVSRKAKDFGGFVGGTVYTEMTNCTVENLKFIVADYYQEIGGFAAYVKYGSKFTNCDVNGLVMDLSNVTWGGYVGGFAGHTDVPYNEAASVPAGRNTMNFIDCDVKDMQITVHGEITGYVSGFCGWTTSRGPSIATNCSIAGIIDTTDATVAASKAGVSEIWHSLYTDDAWTNSSVNLIIK